MDATRLNTEMNQKEILDVLMSVGSFQVQNEGKQRLYCSFDPFVNSMESLGLTGDSLTGNSVSK